MGGTKASTSSMFGKVDSNLAFSSSSSAVGAGAGAAADAVARIAAADDDHERKSSFESERNPLAALGLVEPDWSALGTIGPGGAGDAEGGRRSANMAALEVVDEGSDASAADIVEGVEGCNESTNDAMAGDEDLWRPREGTRSRRRTRSGCPELTCPLAMPTLHRSHCRPSLPICGRHSFLPF